MKCIVSKIEFIGGEVTYTPIGYLTNETDCDGINANYDSTLGTWVESNKTELETGALSVSVFFDTTPIVYVARTTASNVDALTEITDITGLI